MAKQYFLVSPFGELTLRVHPDHIHIEASEQLAGDWALGWWHGHEAGDEAVFARSFWRAELTADPRPTPARSEIDAFIAPWGFAADLNLETGRLPAGLRARVQAYAQGFNSGRKRKPKELPWLPEDCHLLVRTLGFLEWWETKAPEMAFLLESWQAGLPWPRVLDLWPGLGPEPDPSEWSGVVLPGRFSPEARDLISRIRRFRAGSAWVVAGTRSASGRPLLGVNAISDVTEPGLPFLGVRIDSPSGTVRGLSRPGHPGLLTGRTSRLAWHAVPVIDDTIDLRMVDRNQGSTVAGFWAGSGKAGTLEALLTLEEAASVGQAQEKSLGTGTVSLELWAVDSAGGTARWPLGHRWLRPSARDAWLPARRGSEPRVGPRTERGPLGEEFPGRMTPSALANLLGQRRSGFSEAALATLRFLLPDTEEGQRLRRWTGDPADQFEAAAFEKLYGAVLDELWASAPRAPEHESPVAQKLAPLLDKLIQAPHSAWLPSSEKNRRLAEAVRLAFAPGRPPGPPVLARRAVRSCWTENHGGKGRIFAATVAVVADMGAPDWRVFLTDDETEVPGFQVW